MPTEATDAGGVDHEAMADNSVTIVETVSYKGFTTDKEYTLTDTLVDKKTGEPVRLDDKVIASIAVFVLDAVDGT